VEVFTCENKVNNKYRMTIELSPRLRKIIEELASEKEVNLTEIIRNSVLLYDYLNKEVKNGSIIKVNDKEIIVMEFK
jgi:tyrosine-protein phosphatase YwqE